MLFVEPVVVVPAHEHEVVEVGVAVVGPVDAVMGIAATRRDGAAEDPATMVAQRERIELAVGHGAGLPAVVEDRALGARDQPVDSRIARHPAHGLRGEDGAPGVGVERAALRGGDEVAVGNGGDDLGSTALGAGCWLELGECVLGHCDESVGASLRGGALVAVSPLRECADGFLDDPEALGIEQSIESAHAVEELGQVERPRFELFLCGSLGAVGVGMESPGLQHHLEVAEIASLSTWSWTIRNASAASSPTRERISVEPWCAPSPDPMTSVQHCLTVVERVRG